MDTVRFARLSRSISSLLTRRKLSGAVVTVILERMGAIDEAAASKKGKRRRRRRARARERAQEKVCQQVCGGSCKSCRAACAACSDSHFCFHLTDGPPICKIGVITTCEPCSSDADCFGSQFCVTGITFDGTTQRDPQCDAYPVGVCMEELP